MSMLILDIETCPLNDAAQFIEEPSAPANYKDPEKIAAYIAEKRAELLTRCALDVDLCRVVAIGVQDIGSQVWSGLDESDMLTRFWDLAVRFDAFLGFNILGFDLPVLIRRSQYLGLIVPRIALNLDRYRTPHIDLMERLSFNGKLKYRPLAFYCKRFGIDVPDETSGKDVEAMVKVGDWQAVAEHCRADVEKTRRLAERLGVVVQAVADVL